MQSVRGKKIAFPSYSFFTLPPLPPWHGGGLAELSFRPMAAPVCAAPPCRHVGATLPPALQRQLNAASWRPPGGPAGIRCGQKKTTPPLRRMLLCRIPLQCPACSLVCSGRYSFVTFVVHVGRTGRLALPPGPFGLAIWAVRASDTGRFARSYEPRLQPTVRQVFTKRCPAVALSTKKFTATVAVPFPAGWHLPQPRCRSKLAAHARAPDGGAE